MPGNATNSTEADLTKSPLATTILSRHEPEVFHQSPIPDSVATEYRYRKESDPFAPGSFSEAISVVGLCDARTLLGRGSPVSSSRSTLSQQERRHSHCHLPRNITFNGESPDDSGGSYAHGVGDLLLMTALPLSGDRGCDQSDCLESRTILVRWCRTIAELVAEPHSSTKYPSNSSTRDATCRKSEPFQSVEGSPSISSFESMLSPAHSFASCGSFVFDQNYILESTVGVLYREPQMDEVLRHLPLRRTTSSHLVTPADASCQANTSTAMEAFPSISSPRSCRSPNKPYKTINTMYVDAMSRYVQACMESDDGESNIALQCCITEDELSQLNREGGLSLLNRSSAGKHVEQHWESPLLRGETVKYRVKGVGSKVITVGQFQVSRFEVESLPPHNASLELVEVRPSFDTSSPNAENEQKEDLEPQVCVLFVTRESSITSPFEPVFTAEAQQHVDCAQKKLEAESEELQTILSEFVRDVSPPSERLSKCSTAKVERVNSLASTDVQCQSKRSTPEVHHVWPSCQAPEETAQKGTLLKVIESSHLNRILKKEESRQYGVSA